MPGNIQNIPATVYASWPLPNYKNPSDQRTWIVPYACTLQAVTTLMVGTRLLLRLRQQAGAFGLDDALLVPAFLAATMFTTLLVISNQHYGTDRHIWDVPSAWFVPLSEVSWISEIAFLSSTCCTKISVLLFYRRLVRGAFSKQWKYATLGAIAFTVAFMMALIIALIFNCRPTEAYWKAYSATFTRDYTCTDTRIVNPIGGAISVFSDLYSVLLPMVMFRHVHAPRRQRIALNAVFMVGLFVVASGCVRTYYLTRLGMDYDITWVGFEVYVWSTLEIQFALICASAPSLRVFVRQYLSDPISRAVNSARSANSTRNNTHDSRGTASGGTPYKSSVGQSSNGSSDVGDKNLLQPTVEPALETVDETDLESSPRFSTTRSDPHLIIKTPADFEAYALQNLEMNKLPPRPTFLRPPSDESGSDEAQNTFNGPFTDWQPYPKTQLS